MMPWFGGQPALHELPFAAYRTDADGNITWFNDRATDLWGRAPLSGERWCGSHRSFHASGAPLRPDETAVARALRTGQSVEGGTTILETPDGEVKAFRPHPILLRDDGGRIMGSINLLVEETVGWQALSALSEREAWLSGVFNSDVIGLAVFDYQTAKTIKANDYLLCLIGATREQFEAGDRNCHGATPPEYRHLDAAALAQAKVTGCWEPYQKEFERPDGSRVPVRISSAPMPEFAGHCVVCIKDLTEQRAAAQRLQALEAEVHHLARLSAMGTMASILVHEVAQPMTAVSNALSVVSRLRRPPAAEDCQLLDEAIDLAAEQSARAQAIMQRIRHFSAPDHDLRQSFGLRHLVSEAAGLALMKHPGVDVRVSVGEGASTAFGDPVQIEQVLVNLLLNAADAMGGKGAIRVDARRQADRIEVSVIDEGPGFDFRAGKDLFQPFATTKQNGTGLGLPVCRSIVEQHGGSIDVVPSDHGAHVRFTLMAGGG